VRHELGLHTPENGILHSRRSGNLKPYIVFAIVFGSCDVTARRVGPLLSVQDLAMSVMAVTGL
jgi:hypothetical protein